MKSHFNHISPAEKVLHFGFDKVKEGLRAYIDYLTETGSPKDVKHREQTTKRELKKELEDIEKGIEKEIEDIKKR